MTRRLVSVAGPTASGKTELALRLANRFDGEIVGADSRQLYRGLDVGTAKPTPAQRALVPHHLVDVADPAEALGLARYLELAHAALDDIWRRGRIPFLVGGTGQYIWALLEGWTVPRVPPDEVLRSALTARAEREGAGALHAELARVDPLAAAKIHPSNVRRVVRALEVIRRTGRPISACQQKRPLPCDRLVLALRVDRDTLYRRIDERVERMVAGGLVEEVRRLLARGYGRGLPAMCGIGYEEICGYLDGELSLEEAGRRIKTETHRLARHQTTWFPPEDRRLTWVDADEAGWQRAEELVASFLAVSDRVQAS